MKKITPYLSLIAFLALCSMMSSDLGMEPLSFSDHPSKDSFNKQVRPQVEKGVITIKVKKGMDAIPAQKGNVVFNIQSLDDLSASYQLQGLEKRFHYNPSKMRQGLPDLSRIYRITFPESIPSHRVAGAFSKDPNIEYAEPVPANFPCEVPDDQYYFQQHFLPQIQAEEAWDIHKGEDGDEDVVIAVVDTGTDWDHEDLQANAWQNLGEDADGDGVVMEYVGSAWIFDPDDENGIDDDGNGYVDDFTGWGYYYETNDPSPVSGDYAWDHGTHCAGLAATVTDNGIGAAAISWNVEFMSLHIATGDGEEGLPFAYDGIIYAAENGAEIITNSWGGYVYSEANFEVIQYAVGLGSIVVAAAGNDNKYDAHYPSSYPGVISVAAINKNDYKSSYSNYGPNITVGAPGGEGGANGLFSTVPNDSYNWMAGTSMASPTCAGMIGLVQSYYPDWTDEEIIVQVLGTADNINSLNPSYINQLGTGRINAYRALTETGVSLPEVIKMDLVDSWARDLDNDNILAPGDTITFDLKWQNFSLSGTDPNVIFQISCTDPHMTIISDTHTDTIFPDSYTDLYDAFQVVIDEEAGTHMVEFCVTASSSLPILWGDTVHFEALVAPSGTCVYRGEGTGNAYSGEYIQNFLNNNGLECFYTTEMPDHLLGFDVVFMSLGNYGATVGDGTLYTIPMLEAIIEYLGEGGKLYLDCGSFFGILYYVESAYTSDLLPLFCLDSVQTPMLANPIDTLMGLSGSIAEDLYFTGTNQNPYYYIDILYPNAYGTPMMEENDYGVVAIQGEGEFGQKVVMMNYAISKLEAGEPGMTPELMERICEFLGIEIVGVEEMVSDSRFQVSGFPNPTAGVYRIAFTLEQQQCVSWQMFDVRGVLVDESQERALPAGEHEMSWDASGITEGIYILKIDIGDDYYTKKIIKIN